MHFLRVLLNLVMDHGARMHILRVLLNLEMDHVGVVIFRVFGNKPCRMVTTYELNYSKLIIIWNLFKKVTIRIWSARNTTDLI